MSDTQDTMMDFIGIRTDASLTNVDASLSNENENHFSGQVLVEKDSLRENISQDEPEVILEQENATGEKLVQNSLQVKVTDEVHDGSKEILKRKDEFHGNVLKNESELILEHEKGTGYKFLKNELNASLQQKNSVFEQILSEIQNKVDSEIKAEMDMDTDSQSGSPNIETSVRKEDNQNIDRKNAKVESENKTDSVTDCKVEFMIKEDGKVPQNTQFIEHADRQDLKTSSVETLESNDEQIPVSLEHIDKNEVSQSTPVSDVTVLEKNLNSANGLKRSAVKNVETNTDFVEDVNVSQSTQFSDGIVEEQNSNSQNDSKLSLGDREDSGEGTSENETSNNQTLPARKNRMSSERVTAIMSQFFNSEAYRKKLNEIEEIVKQLAGVNLISKLPPQHLAALRELSSYQDQVEEDSTHWETCSEVSESNATKRKSKEPSELDEDEQLQATSKKCKFSKDLDSPGENSCCLEEQFRLAYELSKEDEGQLQTDKEYTFPVITDGEFRKRRYKLCRHQIEKIDSMVESAKSMGNYLSQLNEAIDGYETESSEDSSSSSINSTFSDSPSKKSKSGSPIERTMKSGKKNVACQQKLLHSKDRISESKEGYGYFGLGKVFHSIKNLMVCVSFTAALLATMTIAKVLGVKFPVSKS